MSIKRYVPLIKLFLLPSLTLIIVGLSTYFADKASSQGPLELSSRSKSNSQDRPPKLSNRTSGFEAVNVETKSGRVRLTLKNNYNKTITAYAISTGENTHSLHELESKEFLTPGSTRNQDVRLPSEGNITVLAVVFGDKTSDGDATAVKEINDYRLGKKTQYDRIVPLLNKILAALDNEMLSALEKAEAKIYRFSTDSPEKSHFIIAGLSDAKESILMDLKELKQQLGQSEDTSIVRERIVRIKRSFERYRQSF